MNSKIVITVLIMLNLFLLYRVQSLKVPHSELHTYEKCFIERKGLNKLESAEAKGFLLTAYLYENGCPSCNKLEIKYLNELYNKYPDKICVILLGGSKKYLGALGAKMPHKINDVDIQMYGIENSKYLPIAILTDKNKYVQDIYCAEVGNEEKTKNFYTLVESFFSSIE